MEAPQTADTNWGTHGFDGPPEGLGYEYKPGPPEGWARPTSYNLKDTPEYTAKPSPT